jgi:hypothetical protein
MTFSAAFEEQDKTFPASFKHVQNVSDGGYERGYTEGRAAGYNAGKADGLADGIEQGKQAEWSAFWDIYQDYGNRTGYSIYAGGFAGPSWTDELFKPKYPIAPTDAQMMFRMTGITDLTRDDIHLDFSKCKNMNYALAFSSTLIKLPTIDMSVANSCTSTFADSKVTALSIIVSEATVFTTNTFNGCISLENLTITGVLACAIVLTACTKLNKASIESVMAAVSLTAAITATFSKTAVNAAFETAPGKKDGSSSPEWLALVATRPNCTVALA